MKTTASSTTSFHILFGLLFGVCTWQIQAANFVDMPVKYLYGGSGALIESTIRFYDTYYPGSCTTSSHVDPDGNPYPHGHLPHHFPFYHEPYGPNLGIWVSEALSDQAWDAHYSGYTRVSGSTFLRNCFVHAVGVSGSGGPVVMWLDAYNQFTTTSDLCENTSKGKSKANEDHAIKIIIEYPSESLISCAVKSTSEKNASSGVYTKEWTTASPFINANPTRKNK